MKSQRWVQKDSAMENKDQHGRENDSDAHIHSSSQKNTTTRRSKSQKGHEDPIAE